MRPNDRSVMIAFAVFMIAGGGVLLAAETVDLWPADPPYSKPCELEEYVEEAWGVPCVFDVTHPTLTIHPARGGNTGRAVVILPGGGYELQSFVAEGRTIAEHLSAHGITAAVLKYRLPLLASSDRPHFVPMADARRAVKLVREIAPRYGVDSAKVGVAGFSAGGHLATSVSVLKAPHDDENPAFSVLVYPVTTMTADNQKWLEETLFHRPMTEAEVQRYNLVEHVDGTTPPAFLVHAFDDDVVPIDESLHYAEALTAVGQDVECHFFAKGGHGFGPGRSADGTAQWLDLVADWIRRQ